MLAGFRKIETYTKRPLHWMRPIFSSDIEFSNIMKKYFESVYHKIMMLFPTKYLALGSSE